MKKRLLFVGLGILFLIMNGFLVVAFQQRQEFRTQAAATTSLSFYPPSSFSAPILSSVGRPISVDLMMAPGNNSINRLQVHIVFPKNTFSIAGARFDVNTAVFPQVIVAPTVTEGLNGDINFTVASPTGIGYEAKVGTLTLVPTKVVGEVNQTDGVVGFLPVTSAISVRPEDNPSENAIVSLNQAYFYVTTEIQPTPVLPGAGGGGGGAPQPTFACLGACPTTLVPTQSIPGTNPPPVGGTNPGTNPGTSPGTGGQNPTPTPCAQGRGAASVQDTSKYEDSRRGKNNRKKHRQKHRNNSGLLEILIKLLELLLQLIGGGTGPVHPCNPPATQPDPGTGGGETPDDPNQPEPTEEPEPTEAPEPTAAPEPTEKPEPTEAPEPTDRPEPTVAPTAGTGGATLSRCTPKGPNDPEPPANYTRTTHGGKTVNQRTKVMLQTAERYAAQLGAQTPFSLTQGSYNTGVAASAGTHDGGGVVDINSRDVKVIQALRMAGFAAWIRTPAEGFAYHIHANAIGDKEMAPVAKSQVTAFFDGRNGLAGNGADTAPASVGRPVPQWTAKYGNCN